MSHRIALAALVLAGLSATAPRARAQSDGDLAGSRAMAFIATTDVARARQFYSQVLGMRILATDDAGIVADAGGVRVRILHAAAVTPTPYTALGFEVNDIVTITHRLAARGVTFLHLPELGKAQDASGIWTAPNGDQEVWLKDPDGNILTLSNGRMGR
jgi:catechol 2,3-dioxygenase-like lactoylglutathione lyase family enzyme